MGSPHPQPFLSFRFATIFDHTKCYKNPCFGTLGLSSMQEIDVLSIIFWRNKNILRFAVGYGLFLTRPFLMRQMEQIYCIGTTERCTLQIALSYEKMYNAGCPHASHSQSKPELRYSHSTRLRLNVAFISMNINIGLRLHACVIPILQIPIYLTSFSVPSCTLKLYGCALPSWTRESSLLVEESF